VKGERKQSERRGDGELKEREKTAKAKPKESGRE
jgi:hypothetical protein